ncbi:MAG: acyl-CoA dehydrogenase family protein [bacterium]|nr:acyl-CoA dehydrogenase family protein [bacterium]
MTEDDVRAWIEANWSLDMPLAEWWRRLADSGLAFPIYPSGLGGSGAAASVARGIEQALASAGCIGAPEGIGPSMGAATVLQHGTEEQKRRFLPPLVSGQVLWCQLFSEPGAGSDLASLACRAERDGDEFVVAGQKVWNSGAHLAKWGLLLARTDVDAPKHAGISYLMIDMDQPGIEARPLVQMNGAADFCEVFIDDALVPIENVIGEVNDGWNVARTTLTHERASIGHRRPEGLFSVTAGRPAGKLELPVGELVEEAKAHAADPRRRRDVMVGAKSMIRLAQDTRAILHPAWRDRTIRYWINSRVHQLTIQRASEQAKRGRAGPTGSVTKLSLAMLAHESRDLSMGLLGAEGMLLDDAREHSKVQQACLSSLAPSLGGGTNEIQRNIIGERALGLPREPGIDPDTPFRDLPK